MRTRIMHLALLFQTAVLALVLVSPVRAAEPDAKLVAKAHKFLENEKRAKMVLNFAHFGATYDGIKITGSGRVEDRTGKELSGYFHVTARYYWAGLLSDDEHTDIVFFFNDRGRFFDLREGETTSKVFKPFQLARAIIDLTKDIIRKAAEDSDKDTKDAIEKAIQDVDAKALLRLSLILEQP